MKNYVLHFNHYEEVTEYIRAKREVEFIRFHQYSYKINEISEVTLRFYPMAKRDNKWIRCGYEFYRHL